MRSLITTIDLAEQLGRDPSLRPVLLDVRWRLAGPAGRDSYHQGHLPGAVYLELDAALAAPPGPEGRHPLPSPDVLQRALRQAGIRAEHPVVVYDDADGSVAARAWWLLRWAGHREVAVLDGGFAAWAGEDRPLSVDVPEPEPGDIEVRAGAMPVLDADAAAELARDGVLLDARARERYLGETEPIDPRAGHIPGARNAPYAAHTGADGRWRPPPELAEHFAGAGVTGETAVGAYCGSGVTACSVVLALEVAGRTKPVALYAGSWSEWAADPARLAATGDEPS